MELTTIFYHTDEFCKFFEKEFSIRVLSDGRGMRRKASALSLIEVITIAVYYHQSGYKTFKDYYTRSTELKSAFPTMQTYNRFMELQQKAFIPMALFAKLQSSGKCDKISFIDSFPLRVSHQKRIYSHKTFKGLAARGKTSTGWFYGFKVHVIINSNGEILDFTITPGNVTDNNAKIIERMMKNIHGKVYADKGYLLNADLLQKLLIELRDKTLFLKVGDMVVIPKGVEHKPVADTEVDVMLIEPKTTVSTGDANNIEDKKSTQGEWI